MHLEEHVTQLQNRLSAAAALGDEHTRQTAAALAAAAEPAMRLAVLNAVAAAAAEITAALLDTPGAPAVSVRLDGDELRVDVRETDTGDPLGATVTADDGEATARISLRLSDALKTDIESAARRESVSVNTWLVRAAGATLGSPRRDTTPGGAVRHHSTDNHRISGWINS